MTGRILLAAALAVAGCSRRPERSASGPQSQAVPRPAAAPADAIPADLQGRWALAPADCDAARGDPRGLLTIGAAAFAFGPSPMTVDRVIVRPGRVAFDTTDTTKGVTESRRYAFRRSADGRQLTRERAGLPDQVYTRCPNQPS